MIAYCDACGKGLRPCHRGICSSGESVQCYMCTEGEYDPYGEIDELHQSGKLKEITHREAHVRAVADLPMVIEETRNAHGYVAFRYFIEV